jgi:plasmid maintenance system antidote protein VapI
MVAARRILLYKLAPRIGLHPARLGQLLNEKLPLTPDMAERIEQAVQAARSA